MSGSWHPTCPDPRCDIGRPKRPESVSRHLAPRRLGDFYIVTHWLEELKELVRNRSSSLAIHSSGRHIRASAHRDPKGIPIMKIISNVAPFICLIFTSLLLLPGLVSAQGVVESDTHRFTEIVPDVYHVTGTGSVYTMSNALVLVGESDVLVVDSHVTPAASEALLAQSLIHISEPTRQGMI